MELVQNEAVIVFINQFLAIFLSMKNKHMVSCFLYGITLYRYYGSLQNMWIASPHRALCGSKAYGVSSIWITSSHNNDITMADHGIIWIIGTGGRAKNNEGIYEQVFVNNVNNYVRLYHSRLLKTRVSI